MSYLPLVIVPFLLIRIVGWRANVRNTSAVSAANWAVLAVFVFLLCCAVSCFGVLSIRGTSALQYAAAVMLLTPVIDILGARRPGHNAWPWFVVLPMIAVLQWPVASQLAAGNAALPVEVPIPTFCGYLLVVVMGCGNYFGTSNTTASLLMSVGCVLVALPATEWASFSSSWYVSGASVALALAALSIPRKLSDPPAREDNDRLHLHLWADFRDIYGMVWAKRVMDRVNQFASREKWLVYLTLDGFQPIQAQQAQPLQIEEEMRPSTATSVDDRPLVVLCWVLRRFVDHEFLLRYLPESIVVANATNVPTNE